MSSFINLTVGTVSNNLHQVKDPSRILSVIQIVFMYKKKTNIFYLESREVNIVEGCVDCSHGED